MNSTGLDLETSDLVRNYMLMGCPMVEQNTLYADYWLPMERTLGSLSFDAFLHDWMVVTLQTEVVQRLAAEPGTPDYGLLTVWARRWYDVALVRKVGPGCFFPAPEVGSAVASLRRRETPRVDLASEAHYEALTRAAFQRRRKQMQRVMKDLPDEVGRLEGDAAGWLGSLGIEPTARPWDLSVEDWGRISNAMTEGAP